MQDRDNFLAMLSAIVDQAKSQDNVISMDEIKNLFEGSGLAEEQLDYVCEYLAANQIRIQGYIKNKKVNLATDDKKTEADTKVLEDEKKVLDQLKEKEEQFEQEEAAFIAMYLEDLEMIDPASEGELEQLLISLLQGDSLAKNRILELYLHQVVDIAKDYQGKGIIIGDLIQEGNIALMTALDDILTGLSKEETQSVEDAQNYIANKIISSIEFLINEQKDDKILENRIVDKLNYISECMKKLAEEYGREATLSELADYANMSQDEISDIVELAKGALSVSKGGNK